jgi:hypothetical protein
MGEGLIKKRSGLTNHLRDGMSRCAPAHYSSCLVASNTALWPLLGIARGPTNYSDATAIHEERDDKRHNEDRAHLRNWVRTTRRRRSRSPTCGTQEHPSNRALAAPRPLRAMTKKQRLASVGHVTVIASGSPDSSR